MPVAASLVATWAPASVALIASVGRSIGGESLAGLGAKVFQHFDLPNDIASAGGKLRRASSKLAAAGEGLVQPVHVLQEAHHLVVELAGAIGDFLGVALRGFDLPDIADGAQRLISVVGVAMKTFWPRA